MDLGIRSLSQGSFTPREAPKATSPSSEQGQAAFGDGLPRMNVKHTRATIPCGCSPTEVRVSHPPRPSPRTRAPGCGVWAAQSSPRRSRVTFGHEVSRF